jgi:Tol biopolymer transport system component
MSGLTLRWFAAGDPMADPMHTSSLKSGESHDIPRRTAGGRAVAVLGVILLGACSSSSPAPSTPGSETPSAPVSAAASEPRPDLAGRIVFLRTGGISGDGTVFTANADGSDEQQLSEIGEACCVWAMRDGERVLFSTLAQDGRITTVTVDFDGSDRFVIPLPDGPLSFGPGPFSPDGTQIAFEGFELVGQRPETRGIYIGSADGGKKVQITHDFDIPGDWSPDGTQLLFFREPEPALGPHSLFIVNVDGSGERQLTPDEVVVPCCWGYRWSPDGSRIVFPDEDGVLWLINPDGSDLTQVFVDETVVHVRRSAITPTWSPDGNHIMFGLSPTPSPHDPSPNGLYVINADGTGLTLVIGDNTFKREPNWIP